MCLHEIGLPKPGYGFIHRGDNPDFSEALPGALKVKLTVAKDSQCVL
jgi:hypothetical protein